MHFHAQYKQQKSKSYVDTHLVLANSCLKFSNLRISNNFSIISLELFKDITCFKFDYIYFHDFKVKSE